MRSKNRNLILPALILVGVLSAAAFGALRSVRAASEAGALSADQILDRVENRYTHSEFTADFIQNSFLKAMDISDLASGKVYIKYPGKMRWEYEKPSRQIYITDGEILWVYRPEDNQVQTGKAPDFFKGGKGASFLSDIGLIRQKFDISLEQGPAAEEDLFYHLKLIPRGKTLDITEVHLTISKRTYNVLQVMTLDYYGNENRIELVNFVFGANLDDSLFSFEIPPGADVIQIDE